MPETTSVKPPTSVDGVEIHVIPDAYYGSAVHAPIPEEKPAVAPAPAPATPVVAPKRWPVVVAIGGLIVVIGAGFVYFNRGLLFQQQAPKTADVVQTPPPPPPVPPGAPTGVIATSTNAQSVTLSWQDANADETGFRIERKEAGGDFIALTSLPSNSTSFLDVTVSPKQTYVYRVIAVSAGGSSDPSVEASALVPDPPPVPSTIAKLPPAGLDSDSDGLTDLEETLYGTNANIPDTDGDGFLDGNEVFHLYNPAGKAPVKLLDSSLVKVITASAGWVMSIPTSWKMTLDAPDGSRATLDSMHGETFTISIEDNANRQTVLDWYLARHPNETASRVMQYRSKGGYTGIIGSDMLTTYIPWGSKIFIFTYHLGTQNYINYRTTYSLMLNSLLLSGLPQVTSSTPGVLPFEPSATASGVVAQPVPVTASSTDVTASSTPPTSTSLLP